MSKGIEWMVEAYAWYQQGAYGTANHCIRMACKYNVAGQYEVPVRRRLFGSRRVVMSTPVLAAAIYNRKVRIAGQPLPM